MLIFFIPGARGKDSTSCNKPLATPSKKRNNSLHYNELSLTLSLISVSSREKSGARALNQCTSCEVDPSSKHDLDAQVAMWTTRRMLGLKTVHQRAMLLLVVITLSVTHFPLTFQSSSLRSPWLIWTAFQRTEPRFCHSEVQRLILNTSVHTIPRSRTATVPVQITPANPLICYLSDAANSSSIGASDVDNEQGTPN